MTKKTKQPVSLNLKSSHASAIIIGAFIVGLIATCLVMFGASNWQMNSQNLPNIMPVLMAIIGFFAIGYSVMCILTSKFFQSVAFRRPNYSHLEY